MSSLRQNKGGKMKKSALLIIFSILFCMLAGQLSTSAETVTGGGYTVEQVIAPLQGTVSGNGYIVQQTSQPNGGVNQGGGFTVYEGFGTSTATTTGSGGGGGGGGGGSGGGGSSSGGGYFIFPTQTSTTSSSTSVIITGSSTKPVIVDSGSTCKTRITFTGPIDVGVKTNSKEDVKKLEVFLNTYENEKLPVNGVYEPKDVVAVKKWQSKYKTFILDPMLLKKPTGTIYTLSQRQIERQTTKACGEPVKVTACPYFKEYASYGDKGQTVKKIQQFLNIVRGEKLVLSGVYGPLTKAAVKRFQEANRKDIFSILKLSFISGNWNEATRVKANQAIGCDIIK
jgi:hypothetical protein